MRRILGYVLSVVGIFIFLAAVLGGGYVVIESLIISAGRPRDLIALTVGTMVLVAAFGVALTIIGKDLSGVAGVLFPRIRALATSGPAVVAANIGAFALWGESAWFIFHILGRARRLPFSELTIDYLLGIPFGILIPMAAGFALFAASRIPPVHVDPKAPPPPDAVRMLGNTFTVFGIFWLLFAGTCTWTGGFNPSGASDVTPDFAGHALLSYLFGAIVVAVGVRLRHVAHASAMPPA